MVVLGVVGCVIDNLDLGHVLVHVLGLDLKEKEELVVIEVVHQVLGEIQNAHAHIHRVIEF